MGSEAFRLIRLVLLTAMFVLIFPFVVPAQPWPSDADIRRSLFVRNPATDSLPPGNVVSWTFVPADLELTREDFESKRVRLRFHEKEIPHWMEKVGDQHFRIWFRTCEAIPSGEDGRGYRIYYGEDRRRSDGRAARTVFSFFDDFDGEALNFNRWTAEESISYRIHGSHLIVDNLQRNTDQEDWNVVNIATLRLSDLPEGFALEWDLTVRAPEQSLFAFWLEGWIGVGDVSDSSPGEVQPFLEKLESSDWSEREGAHTALIDMGPSVLTFLKEGMASDDPEIRAACTAIRNEIEQRRQRTRLWLGVQNVSERGAVIAGGVGDQRSSTPGRMILDDTFRFLVARRPDGTVTLSWNGNTLTRQIATGDLQKLSIRAAWFDGYDFGECRVDRIRIRPLVEVEPLVAAEQIERK